MKPFITTVLIYFLLITSSFPAGRIQGADVKSEAELIAAGATKAQMITDNKIYIETNGINDTLANAIIAGVVGGLPSWVALHAYTIDQSIVESNKIYKALSSHTSTGLFSADLAGGFWVELSNTDVDMSSASGTLAIVNGGTGSSTQNFVDLSTNQNVAGIKTFTSPILITPNLGTPSALLATNASGTALNLTAGNANTVITNANLTGGVTSVGNATTVITNANLTGGVTSVGNATTVITNANLTGDITSIGNASTYNVVVPTSKGGTGLSTIGRETNVLKVVSGVPAWGEEDRSNLLVNPNFESASSTGWTCATGTCSITSTSGEFTEGASALKVVPDGFSFDVSQSVNTPSGISKQGVVGVSYRIPSTCKVSTVIRSLVDGVVQTTVPTANLIFDDRYHTIEIPVVFGATSAGIQMYESSLGCTGNIFFDAAYVKRGIGLNSLSNDTEWAACTFSALTDTSAAWFGSGGITNTSLQCRRVGAMLEMKGTFANGTGSANEARLPLPNNYGTILTGTTTATDSLGQIIRNAASTSVFKNIISTNGLGYVNISADSVSTANNAMTVVVGTSAYTNGATNTLSNIRIPIKGWTSSGLAYSQASANTGWVAFTPTSPNSSVTFSSSTCYKQKMGGNLNIRCRGVASASTGSEARIAIPDSLTSSSEIGTVELIGDMIRSGFSATYFRNNVLIEPSVTYLTFGRQDSTTGSITKGTGTSTFSTETISFTASIPIQGWSNAGNIVGSFNEVPTADGTSRPVSFGAMVSSAGAVSLKTGSNLLTTCSTASNVQTCTLGITLAQKATCSCAVAEAPSAANLQCNYDVVNSTTSVIKLWTVANGIASARDLTFHCDGVK